MLKIMLSIHIESRRREKIFFKCFHAASCFCTELAGLSPEKLSLWCRTTFILVFAGGSVVKTSLPMQEMRVGKIPWRRK